MLVVLFFSHQPDETSVAHQEHDHLLQEELWNLLQVQQSLLEVGIRVLALGDISLVSEIILVFFVLLLLLSPNGFESKAGPV